MNYFILFIFLTILVMGYIFDKRSFISYLIMGIFWIITCFSYDAYDYLNYSLMYKLAGNGEKVNYEILFVALMRVGNYIGLNYDQFRMVITLIEIVVIQSTIKKFSKSSNLVWALFLIYPGWLLTTLIRHSLAFSIIVFSMRYVVNKSKGSLIKLIICIITSSLIHSSYWIFISLIFSKFIEQKKLLKFAVSTVAILAVVVLIMGNTNWIVNILNVLPIRTAIIEKYFSGYHQNIVGISYSFFRQALIIGFAGMSVHYFHKARNKNQIMDYEHTHVLKEQFMEMVLPINYCSLFILCGSFFASNSSRLNQIPFFINIIAASICLNEYQNKSMACVPKDKLILKVVSLMLPIVFAILQCSVESPVVFDTVLKMIFETNTFINV